MWPRQCCLLPYLPLSIKKKNLIKPISRYIWLIRNCQLFPTACQGMINLCDYWCNLTNKCFPKLYNFFSMLN